MITSFITTRFRAAVVDRPASLQAYDVLRQIMEYLTVLRKGKSCDELLLM